MGSSPHCAQVRRLEFFKHFLLAKVSGILSEQSARSILSTALQHVCRVINEQSSPAGMQPAQA